MENYNHRLIEKKWQKYWKDNKTFEFKKDKNRKSYYTLSMFLYPSGDMHLGHLKNYSICDVNARFKRLQGFNVLHPTGADACGLPAENAAIKRGIHPAEWTYQNLAKIIESMEKCGLSLDTTKTFATCDEDYQGFQQKIFIDMYKKGLIYRKESYVNWDPVDKTVLANDQVINGRGWRSDAPVEKKKMTQWFVKITDYAEELLQGIKNGDLDGWPEKVRLMQENWIGKSEGATLRFKLIKNEKLKIKNNFIEVYTTRPDTLYGASFIGLSADHPITQELAKNNKEIADFVEECKKTTVDEKTIETMEKKGIFTGLYVEHPFDKNWKLPVWIANFILMDYGTGAIFACPAHDARDYEFAEKYNLPIKQVVAPKGSNYSTSNHSPLEGESNERSSFGGGQKHSFEKLYTPTALAYSQELRKNTTDAEKLLWYYLKDRQMLNVKFRRQAPIGDYIVDFISFEEKLVIELDGGQHNENKNIAYDKKRTEFLNSAGYRVLRFWDNEIFENMKGVLETIYNDIVNNTPHQNSDGVLTPPQGGSNSQGFQRGSDSEFPFEEEGIVINSDFLNGLTTKEAKQKAIEKIEEMGIGERKVNYRLRDWCISRQRYWGCPIPMIHCEHCGVVPATDLPVKLPKDVVFDGKGNPLANHPTWKYTTCPVCGKPAIRETDTMDTFMDSSWYFMRFVDLCKDKPINTELCNELLPIDQYTGGIEHATGHLIFARFLTKVMSDMGYLDKSIREPAKKLFNQGMLMHKAYKDKKRGDWVLAKDVVEKEGKYYNINTGEEVDYQGIIKMSKSKLNVVNVSGALEDYGADACRLYVLSDTPAEKESEWTTEGIEGCWKFVNRIWKVVLTFIKENDIEKLKNIKINIVNDLLKEHHKAIKDTTDYLENLQFNKAIARLREFFNAVDKFNPQNDEEKAIKFNALFDFVKMIAPFTPHICEELNQLFGNKTTLDKKGWPEFREELTIDNEITIAIQVNGKLRGNIQVKKDANKEEIEAIAKEETNTKKHLEGKEIKKVIVVPGKLINFVAI